MSVPEVWFPFASYPYVAFTPSVREEAVRRPSGSVETALAAPHHGETPGSSPRSLPYAAVAVSSRIARSDAETTLSFSSVITLRWSNSRSAFTSSSRPHSLRALSKQS